MKKYALVPGLLICAVFIGTIARYGHASTGENDAPASAVLIQEIRSLRKSFETLAASNSRTQFAIERCRLQQRVVEHLTDQMNSIQSEIDSNEDLFLQLEQNLKNIDASPARDDEDAKRQADRDRKSTASSIEVNRARNQALQERKIQIEASLQTQNRKLDELTEALELLARENGTSEK